MPPSINPRKVIRHLMAIGTCAIFVSLICLALYIGLIAWSDDMGGPLNLIIIPAFGFFLGLVLACLFGLPLGILYERKNGISWNLKKRLIIIIGPFLPALIILGIPVFHTKSEFNPMLIVISFSFLILHMTCLIYITSISASQMVFDRLQAK